MGQSMGIPMPLTKVVLLQKHKSGLPVTRNTAWMNPEDFRATNFWALWFVSCTRLALQWRTVVTQKLPSLFCNLTVYQHHLINVVKTWLPLRTKCRCNPSLLACQSALHWCNRIKISTYQTKSTRKTNNNCDAISSGWREKADTINTLKGIILKINFLTELCLNAMRKGGWEKNS